MHSKVIHPPAPNKISVGHQSIPQMSVIIPLSPENHFALFSTGSLGFPGTSGGKDSTCNAGVPGSIPGLGSSSPGEGIGYPLQYSWASTVAQMVKNLLQCGRPGFDPWFGKIPWRSGNPLRYSCLENPMDGGAWWCDHGVTESQYLTERLNTAQALLDRASCYIIFLFLSCASSSYPQRLLGKDTSGEVFKVQCI